jgi:hypothetical protein
MKKQNQTYLPGGRKLSLNKKTISNLSATEMSRQMGGSHLGGNCGTWGCPIPKNTKNCTQNQNTCPGHNTCQYTCV